MSDLAIHSRYEKDIEELVSEEQAIRDQSHEDEDLMVDVVECEDDNEEEEEYDELEQFVPLLKSMKLDRLPAFAVSVRMQKMQSEIHQQSANTDAQLPPLTCTILYPLSGSFNILFQLEFSDGVRWLFKVPVTGYLGRFDELAAQALTCEAMTMRLLKRETTILVPEVYSFDASLNNDVNCPFIMMEYIQGRPLYELWFQPSSCDAAMKQFRERILGDLAAAMAQLSSFTLHRGGSLRFDSEGRISDFGPSRVLDLGAQYDKMNSGDYDGSPIFCVKGPFDDAKSFLKFNLDRRGPIKANPARFHRGNHMLLRQFMDWISTNQSMEEPQFVLTHPDYALQNILVSEDGTLRGIIDWDGVAAIPRCMGQYPLWLMRDWDPASYNYDYKTGKLCDPDGQWENTPEELESYRKLYARSMEQCISEQRGRDGTHCKEGELRTPVLNQSSNLGIRKSILAWSLAVAADDSMSTTANVGLVFREIGRLTTASQESSSPATDSDASGGDEAKTGADTDSTSHTSAGMDESPSHKSLINAAAPSKSYASIQEVEALGIVDGGLPEFPVSDELRCVEDGPSRKAKPIYNRIQDALRCNGRVLHKKNLKKAPKDLQPLPAIIQPAVAEACPTKNAISSGSRIQTALDHTVGLLGGKGSKASADGTKVKSASTQLYTNDNVKLRGGGFRNLLHSVIGFLKKPKVEKPHKDAVNLSNPVEVSSGDRVEPCQGRDRSAVHKTPDLPRNHKSKHSPEVSKPLPADVEASTSQAGKPYYVDAGHAVQPMSPYPQDSKVERAEAQGSLSPVKEEVGSICHQAILKLEDAGIFSTISKEHRALIEGVIKQVAEASQRGLPCISDAKPAGEVLRSAEVVKTQDVPLTPVAMEKEAPGSAEASEAKDEAPTPAKAQKKEYDPSQFLLWSVAHGIADGELSDEFWQRLERGFAALVASL